MGFDPLGAFRTLNDHGVRYIVIGGIAASIHGSPSVTQDLDVCYERSAENLERLAAALVQMNARLRGVEDEVPFILDAATLRAGDHFTFETDLGAFDCLGTPDPFRGGFGELSANALEVDLDGLSVRVASLDDLIRMKTAAGRPKDRIELEVLGALREELEKRDRDT